MPATAQREAQKVAAEDVTAAAIASEETIVPPPPEFDREALSKMVSEQVAQALVGALPALLPEMLKTLAPSSEVAQHGPSRMVSVGVVNASPVKANYLKHYRRDNTVSGKYQMVDVDKLVDGEIEVQFTRDHNDQVHATAPAVLKGQWVHFVNNDFYATTEKEVAFVEWKMKTDPQFRVYEVVGGGTIRCPVYNCTVPAFGDEETLKNHMRATHGV
jgi:hypothetical protein